MTSLFRGVLLATWILGGSTGCAAQLVRKAEAAGDHEGAVTAASKLSRPPRGKTALALARSLVALQRIDEARSVLEVASRRGGDLDAMQALARLELERGLLGTAAERYARLLRLDPSRLEGNEEVCALWRARALAYFEQDEPIAADADLRRARRACGVPRDPVAAATEADLFERVRPAAEARVLARRTLSEALRADLRARDVSSLADDAALAAARAAGPRELLRFARGVGRSLPPSDVADVLAAEFDGKLGVGLISDDTVAALVGDAAPESIVEAASALDPSARGYVALRVLRARPLPSEGFEAASEPAGDREGADVAIDLGATVDVAEEDRDALTDTAERGEPTNDDVARTALAELRSTPPAGSNDPNVQGLLTLALSREAEHPGRAYHRAMLLVGDTSGAELVLVDRIAAALDAAGRDRCTGDARTAGSTEASGGEQATAGAAAVGPAGPSRRRGRGVTSPPQPAVPACTRPTTAAMLTLADAAHLPWLLDLSRLRERGGRFEDALTLRLSALALARKANVQDVGALVEGEVRHAFARGKPWTALALAQLADANARRVFEIVAGSMLDLLDATCGEGCTSGERVVVERVVDARRGELGLAPSDRSWSDEAGARARASATSDAPQPTPARSCISSRALLGARAEGSLAALVRRTLIEGTEPSPTELAAVVERDLTRMCSTELAVALLARASHTLAAETLSERFTMLPQSSAARVLALEGDLALLANEPGRARGRWVAAAAESTDPREVWLRAALLADERGARELKLEALRELERLADARRATGIRRVLLVEQLAEMDVVVGGISVLDSAGKAVQEHLERLPASLRWRERQALLLALAHRRGLGSEALALALAVVVEGDTAAKHGAALEVIAGSRGMAIESDAYHGSPMAMAAAGEGSRDVFASAEVWLDGSELHQLALARMRSGEDMPSRVRSAVAALHVGDAHARAEALAWLMQRTSRGDAAASGTGEPAATSAGAATTPDPRSEAGLEEKSRTRARLRVAEGATALDPAAVRVLPAVDDPEALLRILLEMPLDAWEALRGER